MHWTELDSKDARYKALRFLDLATDSSKNPKRPALAHIWQYSNVIAASDGYAIHTVTSSNMNMPEFSELFTDDNERKRGVTLNRKDYRKGKAITTESKPPDFKTFLSNDLMPTKARAVIVDVRELREALKIAAKENSGVTKLTISFNGIQLLVPGLYQFDISSPDIILSNNLDSYSMNVNSENLYDALRYGYADIEHIFIYMRDNMIKVSYVLDNYTYTMYSMQVRNL